MIVELLNTGSELLLGRVLNTNQQWLCRQLADLGYVVNRQVAVPDTALEIQTTVKEALTRADLVITTGGLGPTSDDLTRDLIAKLLGKDLREDPSVIAQIQSYFNRRGRPMPARTRVEAMVPDGATALPNAFGTAPGLALEVQPNPFRPGGAGSWLILLPGPPRELRPMFTDSVVPLLRRVLPPTDDFTCRSLRSTGMGETQVEERVGNVLAPLVAGGLELGYCARPGQVDIRLAGHGTKGSELVRAAERIVRSRLEAYIYGENEDELEHVILKLLTDRRRTLAVAESCTGGSIADRLTNVPGASAVLLAGWVTYSNESKQNALGVTAAALAQHGAVSQEVAREMAEGARARSGADFALSVTGIAGPSGGTAEKPVGTVFIGLAGPFPTEVIRQLNPWDRLTFKQVTTQQTLELLRRKIRDTTNPP